MEQFHGGEAPRIIAISYSLSLSEVYRIVQKNREINLKKLHAKEYCNLLRDLDFDTTTEQSMKMMQWVADKTHCSLDLVAMNIAKVLNEELLPIKLPNVQVS